VGPPNQQSKLKSTERATHCRETLCNLREARETELTMYFMTVLSFYDLQRLAWPPDLSAARTRFKAPSVSPIQNPESTTRDTGIPRDTQHSPKPIAFQATRHVRQGLRKGVARCRWQGSGFPVNGFDVED
jgi:hypothetical protein